MCGCTRGGAEVGRSGQVTQTSGCGLAVHSSSGTVQKQRPVSTVVGRAVDGSGDRGWQRDQHDLVAFAVNSKDAMAVFFAEVGDVGPGGFEHSQPEQSK